MKELQDMLSYWKRQHALALHGSEERSILQEVVRRLEEQIDEIEFKMKQEEVWSTSPNQVTIHV